MGGVFVELVKKNIHMDYTKATATNQFVLEEDMNLPDVKPDMDKIIFKKYFQKSIKYIIIQK